MAKPLATAVFPISNEELDRNHGLVSGFSDLLKIWVTPGRHLEAVWARAARVERRLYCRPTQKRRGQSKRECAFPYASWSDE
jgi:hypothetical protein